tara:strand:- start:234 stop:800 length:567 start_codon:yes stop_codon:yes gene_type:complete
MAIVLNGSTNVISGVAVGGLPDGIVDTDMIAANAVTAAKRGTGAILQVVESGFSGEFQTASTSFTDVTNAIINITPTSSSSKVLLFVNLDSDYVAETNALRVIYTKLFRDSTAIYKQAWYQGHGTSSNGWGYYATPIDMLQLDSPSTTSQVTYKVQAKIDSSSNGALFRVNMVTGQCNSSLVAMEVAG